MIFSSGACLLLRDSYHPNGLVDHSKQQGIFPNRSGRFLVTLADGNRQRATQSHLGILRYTNYTKIANQVK